MKIASITITSNKHSIIGDALRSVSDLADIMVIVDIGVDAATLKAIEEVALGRAAYVKSRLGLPISDWRNLGLKVAYEAGADWAIMLDTDERMVFKVDVKALLGDCQFEVLSALHVNGSYSRERFFKLPVKSQFWGVAHEAWQGSSVALVHGVYFDELVKDEEHIDRSIRELDTFLQPQQDEKPSLRWLCYQGHVHSARGEIVNAIEKYRKALKMEAGPEYKAMVCYWMASRYLEIKQPKFALERCLEGLKHHPGVAELSWLAGVCCLMLGRLQEAMCWANMAISNGLFVRSGFAANRLGNREPYALWEGPFELQRDCMKAMGWPEPEIQKQNELIEEVKKARAF